jgi:enterochelin esterase-like enzyme
MFNLLLLVVSAALCASATSRFDHYARALPTGLDVKISVAKGLLTGPIDGHVILMFAPNNTDPLNNTDVTSSRNSIFGKDVYDFGPKNSTTFSGGSNFTIRGSMYGWPNLSLDNMLAGEYRVQAFFNKYERVKRSDGSKVSVHFPFGDSALDINTSGILVTDAVGITVNGSAQTFNLEFKNTTAVSAFPGKEIGGCNQGNCKDTENLKYIKIRSEKLSSFWKRDMFVGANVLLPVGYNAKDKLTLYPVIYSQGHWPGSQGAFGYPNASFSEAWDNGTIPGTDTTAARPAPKMILVTFRHETPFYDDSYAVNTANLGPYGDAINDELIPHLEEEFNTIRAPYARIQEGGSTGGWESAANLIYRPDLFGYCFSSYPDSLDFHRHQDIELYSAENAYQRADGSFVPSIRQFVDGAEVVQTTVAQENHWELTFGSASRSSNQWDIWNAVFGVQGYNNYPLEPWDKVTGEIYPEAVEYWKPYDLSNYIIRNWNTSRELGQNLAGRIFVYVGSNDNYYLNEGVQEFQNRTDAAGGSGWANITILPEKPHGGNYQDREIWNYLEFLDAWIKDHAWNGTKPLSDSTTAPSTRGNLWKDVLKHGGRAAAVARQAWPALESGHGAKVGSRVSASVGRWDPGMRLKAHWVVNGKRASKVVSVKQGVIVKYKVKKMGFLQLSVTGTKRNYVDETRLSDGIDVSDVLAYNGTSSTRTSSTQACGCTQTIVQTLGGSGGEGEVRQKSTTTKGHKTKTPKGPETKTTKAYETKTPKAYETKATKVHESKSTKSHESKTTEGYKTKPTKGYNNTETTR